MEVSTFSVVIVLLGFQKFLKSLFGIKAIPWNVNNSFNDYYYDVQLPINHSYQQNSAAPSGNGVS